MENVNLILFICLFIPMCMMLFVFKGQSRLLCGFLLIGMFVCVFSGEINCLIMKTYDLDVNTISINIAPLVEEILKAFPIILVSLLYKPSKQQIAEYALSVGVGFATLENVSILISSHTISFMYAFLRAIGTGMMHGICTLFIGIVMRNIIYKKKIVVSGTLAALSISVIYHSIYNMLVLSKYIVFGAILPILTFVVIILIDYFYKKNNKVIRDNLEIEREKI